MEEKDMKAWNKPEIATIGIEMTEGGWKAADKENGAKFPEKKTDPVPTEPIIQPATPSTEDNYITDSTSGPALVL